MSHKFLMPFLIAAFLIVPAVLPSVLVSAMALGLSGAAQAKAINLNSSRSNNYRVRNPSPGARVGTERMGGGGGSRTMGAERMGGGGGRTK